MNTKELSEQSATHNRPSHGGGPRTEQGKARSKYNAAKHHFLTRKVLGDEEQDYAELFSTLSKALNPGNGLESILVEKLAFAFLRLRRLYGADVKTAPLLFEKVNEALANGNASMFSNLADNDSNSQPAPDLLLRYESVVERGIERTLGQLERLRQLQRNKDSKASGHSG